jgi:glyoxylase-like metal-dependent hydrolase (beta-lactamase superfamily II)
VPVQFLSEPEPQRGIRLPVAAGIDRIVASNPGPMTYHGTNTYLIDGPDGVMVLDPGPDDPRHLAAIVAATSGRIARILVSHAHVDHVGTLAGLRAACGAPVFAWQGAPAHVAPDHRLRDGDVVSGWTALHTPGHAPDHLCLARSDGVVLSADHVMGWSTSVVSPPDGDMAAYVTSLNRLLARSDRLYAPGHGPAIAEPARHVRALIEHRNAREAGVLAALRAGPCTVPPLVDTLYAPVDPRLRGAAERNVLAHLLKLRAEGRVREDGAAWRLT